MDVDDNQAQILAKLFTKLTKYQISESPFSLPVSAGCTELQHLLNGLLAGEDEVASTEEFDFLIEGEFLRSTLKEYLERKQISSETVLEIEFILRNQSPELEHGLQHDDWVSALDCCHGRILTGSYDNTVSIWNTKGKCLLTLEGHHMPVKSVRWIGNDGGTLSLLSASHDQTILIWQLEEATNDCRCVHICKGHAASVDAVAVQPGNKNFASGSWDKMIKIWDASVDVNASDEINPDEISSKRHRSDQKTDKPAATTRTPLATLSGHKEPVSSVQWGGTGNELFSAGWDHAVRVWDVETGTNVHTLNGAKAIFSLSYSPLSNLIATGSADKNIHIWDPRAQEGTVVKSYLSSHNGWISSVEWSPSNEHQLLSGSYDNKVKLWDIRCASDCLYDLTKHTEKVLCLSWTEPEVILSGGADNNVNMHRYGASSTNNNNNAETT